MIRGRDVPRQLTLPAALPMLALVAFAAAVPLQAQPPAGPDSLRQEIEAEYRVTSSSSGVVLLPRNGERGIALIELRGDRVYLDGNGPVSAQRLAAALGAEAALLLRLTSLDPEAQRSVLGLPPLAAADVAALVPASEPVEPSAATGPGTPAPGVLVSDDAGERTRDRRVVRRDIVRFGGHVHVAADERVRGDVVVIGGSLRVDGEVSRDITVIGGSATFGPEAIARRDVTIVGGRLTRDPGARFDRGVNEVNFNMVDLDFGGFDGWPNMRLPRPSAQVYRSMDLMGSFIRFAFFGLLGSVVLLVAGGSSERVAERVTLEPVKAGFVGFLAQLLFVPLLLTGILLLVVTIIGIPLLALVPVVLVGAMVVLMLGFTGVAQGVSRLFASGGQSALVLFWVGLVLLMTPTLFGEALELMGDSFGLFAVILGVTGFVVEYVAWTAGAGAVILNWHQELKRLVPVD